MAFEGANYAEAAAAGSVGQSTAGLTVAQPSTFTTRVPISLYFPNDYRNIDHYVTFRALKFERVTRTSTLATDEPLVNTRNQNVSRLLASISLPMPGNLTTGYKIDYDDAKISSIGELAASMASMARGGNTEAATRALGQGINEIYQAASGGQGIASGARAAGETIVRQLQQAGQTLPPGIAYAALASATAGIGGGSTVGNAVLANFVGIARNAHKVVLFEGVDFRTHTFNYRLSPRNSREAKSIELIIKAFKYYMSPQYGLGEGPAAARGLLTGLGFPETGQEIGNISTEAGRTSRAFFEYPDVFTIEFQGSAKTSLFTIGESVLKSFVINYHPTNYPAYVRSLNSPNVSSPAEIEISLSFQETDIVTKEQIDRNGR